MRSRKSFTRPETIPKFSVVRSTRPAADSTSSGPASGAASDRTSSDVAASPNPSSTASRRRWIDGGTGCQTTSRQDLWTEVRAMCADAATDPGSGGHLAEELVHVEVVAPGSDLAVAHLEGSHDGELDPAVG